MPSDSHQSNLSGFDCISPHSSYQDGIYPKFTQKHVFSLKNNPMLGVTFCQWLNIGIKHVRYVEFKYLPRFFFITAISLFNSSCALIEYILFERKIRAVTVPSNPVFVVGHPRTGTTLIHNLLASDTENFYCCTTFCAGFPSCFLWFETLGKKLFSGMIEKTRPMDAMPLHFDLPQEDECAVNLLSKGRSFYMPLWFMSQEAQFRKYLDFSAEDGGCPADEAAWTAAFLYFMRKLTLRNQREQGSSSSSSPRRLLIKSPIHTARIPLLRRLFPAATFIYVHRDPLEVFQSAAHMADTAYWFCYLNTPSDAQVHDFILWQFERMWAKYDVAARAPPGPAAAPRAVAADILEVAYADLVADPPAALRRMYAHAGVAWTPAAERRHRGNVAELRDYRPNSHRGLPAAARRAVYERWRPYFDALGYPAP